jgi:glycosyltransferase involved in cell wall biosynthesis
MPTVALNAAERHAPAEAGAVDPRRVSDLTPRIGILYTAALRQGGGIGRYTRELVDALARSADAEAFQVTLVVARDAPRYRLPALPPGWNVRVLPLPERWLTILWHRLHLPLWVDAWAGSFDIFHAPDFVLPPLRRASGLVTVHDLSFITYPEGAVPELRQWLSHEVPRSIARARHVLADSESTRRDLGSRLGVDPARITVVGAGVEARFRPVVAPDILAAVRRRYGLPERFILGLGTLEPRKNFDGLIRAFDRIQADAPDLHLVIVGGKGWLNEPIFQAAAASPAAGRVHLAGFVADEDLPALYSLARLFAYPSHYEGFGIPMLEAMACGTPVVAADNSSLPEVAGDAALLIRSTDEAALAAAMLRLHRDEALRATCIEHGAARAAAFTWGAAAERLIRVYRTAMG